MAYDAVGRQHVRPEAPLLAPAGKGPPPTYSSGSRLRFLPAIFVALSSRRFSLASSFCCFFSALAALAFLTTAAGEGGGGERGREWGALGGRPPTHCHPPPRCPCPSPRAGRRQRRPCSATPCSAPSAAPPRGCLRGGWQLQGESVRARVWGRGRGDVGVGAWAWGCTRASVGARAWGEGRGPRGSAQSWVLWCSAQSWVLW